MQTTRVHFWKCHLIKFNCTRQRAILVSRKLIRLWNRGKRFTYLFCALWWNVEFRMTFLLKSVFDFFNGRKSQLKTERRLKFSTRKKSKRKKSKKIQFLRYSTYWKKIDSRKEKFFKRFLFSSISKISKHFWYIFIRNFIFKNHSEFLRSYIYAKVIAQLTNTRTWFMILSGIH